MIVISRTDEQQAPSCPLPARPETPCHRRSSTRANKLWWNSG
jgi:hypothetical protein